MGCTFDRTKVFGPITESSLPITGGLTAGIDTNILTSSGLVNGTVDQGAGFFAYRLNSSLLPPIRYTNIVSGYYLTGTAGNWSIFDTFDTLSYTNKYGGAPTNGVFTSANDAPSTNYFGLRYGI